MKRIEVDRQIIELWGDNYFEIVEYYPEYYEIMYKGELFFTASEITSLCYECVKTSLTHKIRIKIGDILDITVDLDIANNPKEVRESWKKHVDFILGFFNNILYYTDLSVTYCKDGFNIWEMYNDEPIYIGSADGVSKYIKLYMEKLRKEEG